MSNVIKKAYTLKPFEGYQIIIDETPFTTKEVVEEPQMVEVEISIEEEMKKVEEFLNQAKLEANRMKREADSYAHKIYEQIKSDTEKAEEELKQKEKEALENGYNAGYHQGVIDGKQTYQEKLLEAEKVINLAEKDYKNAVEKSEDTIVEIACAAAEKVVSTSLIESESSLVSYIKAAIKQVRECENIKIRIAPMHYERILKYKAELEEITTSSKQIYIIPDEDLDELTCYIESETGRLDISVDTQFHELRNKLLDLVQGEK